MKKNPWKIAFLTLVGIIVAIIIWLGVLFFMPTQKQVTNTVSTSDQPLVVSVTPQQASLAVNEVIAKQDLAVEPQFKFGKTSEITGTVPFLGKKVPYTLVLEPKKMAGGDLSLVATKVKAGNIPLPKKVVLLALKGSNTLPDWIQIDAKNSTIDVYLTQLPLNDFSIRVKSLDWKNNQIQIALYYKEGKAND